jgi:hypothetical protein
LHGLARVEITPRGSATPDLGSTKLWIRAGRSEQQDHAEHHQDSDHRDQPAGDASLCSRSTGRIQARTTTVSR